MHGAQSVPGWEGGWLCDLYSDSDSVSDSVLHSGDMFRGRKSRKTILGLLEALQIQQKHNKYLGENGGIGHVIKIKNEF